MDDKIYMRRALELAAMGAGHVSPNPMVGAVIVDPTGRIIGEGFHRKYGGPHAEVNAMASVKAEDRHLIKEATVYVTLEPCSHYGKTPPCAEMLCRERVRRVVVGVTDPNPKVAGRGIRMLREAGIEVIEDCLKDECLAINERFFTAHIKHRPWILLKWAETEYGSLTDQTGKAVKISSPSTLALMHTQRALCDAILVGTNTLLQDNPSLDNRLWPGNSPRPVIFESDSLESVRKTLKVFRRDPLILDPTKPLKENMESLFNDHGITSLMVEGGKKLLDSFLEEGLYDRIRIEQKFVKIP